MSEKRFGHDPARPLPDEPAPRAADRDGDGRDRAAAGGLSHVRPRRHRGAVDADGAGRADADAALDRPVQAAPTRAARARRADPEPGRPPLVPRPADSGGRGAARRRRGRASARSRRRSRRRSAGRRSASYAPASDVLRRAIEAELSRRPNSGPALRRGDVRLESVGHRPRSPDQLPRLLRSVAARPQDAVEQVRRPFQAGGAEEERFTLGAVEGVAHGVEGRVRQVDVRVLERDAHVDDPCGVDRLVVGPPDVAGVAGHVDEGRDAARGGSRRSAAGSASGR